MEYVKAAQTDDFTSENKVLVQLNGKEILLTNVDNEYYAIDNRCPHMGGSLYDGNLSGSIITCPRHHSKFDVKTGKVIKEAKILFIKLGVNDTQSYPVKVEGNDIFVGL